MYNAFNIFNRRVSGAILISSYPVSSQQRTSFRDNNDSQYLVNLSLNVRMHE